MHVESSGEEWMAIRRRMSNDYVALGRLVRICIAGIWLTEFLPCPHLEAADPLFLLANAVLGGSPSFRTVRCSPSLPPPLERFVPNAHVADYVNSKTPTKYQRRHSEFPKILRLLHILAS